MMNEKKFKEITKKIGKRYLEKIRENSLFLEAKLSKAIVKYVEDDSNPSNGCFSQEVKANSSDFGIIYFINPNDPQLYIEFITAHELAHLVFYNGGISCADICKTDDSFAITYVTRGDETDEYGQGLEECLADYFALYIVKDLYPTRTIEEIAEIIGEVNPETRLATGTLEITKKIISMFDCEFGGLLADDSFDAVYEDEESMQPKNLLTYEACIGNMSTLIEEYDAIMGKKGWKILNKKLDIFLEKSSSKNLKNLEREIEFYFSRKKI